MQLRQALPAITAMFCLNLIGCGTTPEAGPSAAPNPNSGSGTDAELITPGITLKAMDGSFVIYPGVPFQTPDFSKTDNNNLGGGSGCGAFSYQAVVGAYRAALKCGAVPVLVYASGRVQPLYGLLMLNQLDPTIQAMGVTYRIEVPRPAIRTAAKGEMTVLYATAASETVSQYAWLLWLADHPLR
jgi:hypothetical protein